MDKYTVDLDKVLNDFEYSELTENQNTSVNHQSPRPPLAAPTVKHSINTVFNSLNEYLNTDIKATELPEATEPNLPEIETTPPVVNKQSISSIQDIFKSINSVSQDEEIPEIHTTVNNNTAKIDLNLNTANLNNNENSADDDDEDDDEEEEEESEASVFQDVQEPEITEQEIDLERPKENNVIVIAGSQESSIDTTKDCKEDDKEEEIPTSKILSVSDENIEVMIVQNPEKPSAVNFFELDEDMVSDTEIENELAVLEAEYQEKLKLELDCSSQDVNIENLKTETETVNNNVNSSIVIQNDALVVNDLIHGQEVEEIEENKIEVRDEPKCQIEEHNAVELVEDSEVINTVLRPNSLELPSETPINLIGEPGSTPYNNTYNSIPKKADPPKQKSKSLAPEVFQDAQLVPVPEGVAASTVLEIEVSAHSLSPTLSESSTFENSNSDSPRTSDSCNDTSLEEYTTSNQNTPKNSNERKTSMENSTGEGIVDNESSSASFDNSENNRINNEVSWLGKTAPFWTPDSEAVCCLHCNQKFTVIKRRHHCRACGLVLCSKCCNMKFKLQFMDNMEARVCIKCYEILSKDTTTASSSSEASPENRSNPEASQSRSLNPNNPMEYCSKIPPHQQVSSPSNEPPSVMVPVGVLKRKGSAKSRSGKSVMFCDGIRPGCDLTELDRDFNYKEANMESFATSGDSSSKKPVTNNVSSSHARVNTRNLPKIDGKTSSFIPNESSLLPPIVHVVKADIFYAESPTNNIDMVEILKNETITFGIQRNLLIHVKIINMDCCVNKLVWCFSSEGMISVGQDEIVVLLEFIDNEKTVPKDVFVHLNNIYNDAIKGTSITEMGISIHPTSNFLESKNHAGFLYIKPTFQCVQNLILPKEPFLIGILIHRWETPWAKIFPLRLLLRLGAEYRYYPAPLISTRYRESVYVEIGHTIINLLADFRNFSYTIPAVRGLTIHMEDKNTTVSIPMNRYDQVMKALSNSSDHILAFAANFSSTADSHLVCIQDTHGNNENAYTTHAINIHNKPRKVTGASFIVLNGALKSSSGLTAKSSIVEDGLMIQILPEQMLTLRNALKNMKNFKINCGCVNSQSDESVSILWTDNDVNFNNGVLSPIDNMALTGIPSIRVHNGKDYICNNGNKMIRWTEVFIIQSGEEVSRQQDPVDISKISESISKSTSQALVKYLELLATNSCTKIGIRTTLNVENVSYLAGSNGTKLPPIYMKSLDNELIPVLHRITGGIGEQTTVILELKFHILNV